VILSDAFQLYGYFVFGMFGALLGSFGNVIIYRWPKGLSVVSPRSACPHCSKVLSPWELIPIFSWIFLRGKCSACAAPISPRYPLVEMLMTFLFCLTYYRFGWSWTSLELTLFIFAAVTASFIDLDHFLLPDVLTLSGIGIGLLGAIFNPERQFMGSLLGVLVGGGMLWAVAYFYYLYRKEEGMGGGDIKLLAWIGAVFGWKAIPFIVLVSSVLGTFGGIAAGLKSNKGMKAVIPFGPYLVVAALIYAFGAQSLAHTYLRLFLPFVE